MTPLCPQYFIRAFLISTLPIASPGMFLVLLVVPPLLCWMGSAWGLVQPARSLHVASWALASSLTGTKGRLQGLLRHEPQGSSRSVCLLCRLPNNNCVTAKAGWRGESSWAGAIPESTGSLSRAYLLALLSLRSNNFQIYSFLTEHLSKWV